MQLRRFSIYRYLFAIAWIGSIAIAQVAPAQASQGTIAVSPRQILTLYPIAGGVMGSFTVAVLNDTGAAQKFRVPLLLPLGVTEFLPRGGLESEHIEVGADGALVGVREFPPGQAVVEVSFQMDMGGRGDLSVVVPDGAQNLTVMYPPTDGFAVRAPGFSETKSVPHFQGRTFLGIANTAPIPPGTTIRLSAVNLPEGRNGYTVAAGALAIMLVVIGGTLAWTRRPRLEEWNAASDFSS